MIKRIDISKFYNGSRWQGKVFVKLFLKYCMSRSPLWAPGMSKLLKLLLVITREFKTDILPEVDKSVHSLLVISSSTLLYLVFQELYL